MRRLLSSLAVIVLVVSCTAHTPSSVPSETPTTWAGLFTAWHHAMDDHYVFWDLDSPGSEWDDIYSDNIAFFQSLTSPIGEDADESELAYRRFFDIVSTLSDGHYALRINDGTLDEPLMISPYAIRMYRGLGLTDDEIYDYYRYGKQDDRISSSAIMVETPENILRYTFGIALPKTFYGMMTERDKPVDGFRWYRLLRVPATSSLSIEAYDFTGLIGEMDNGMLYVFLSSFTFAPYSKDYENGATNVFTDYMIAFREALRTALTRHRSGERELTGIIVDLRGNQGGYASDLSYFWGDLLDSDILIGYSRRKIGANRLSYGPWLSWTVAGTGKSAIDIPIAVLVNGRTISCGEISAMLFMAMSDEGYDVTVIGERTAGAHGAIVDDDTVFNAGSFAIPPYIELVYTPSMETRYRDMASYEGRGLPVDIDVGFDAARFRRGDDRRLETAVEIIENSVQGG